jgi:ArsR family transcriptional regulator, virulence genes transcriptional regulator
MGYSVKKVADITISGKKGNITIEGEILHNAALVIRALNHPLRKKIVELIETKGELTVTEIYVQLRTEQSVASQHLAILREARWLNTRRDGKFIYYRINEDRFKQVADVISLLL